MNEVVYTIIIIISITTTSTIYLCQVFTSYITNCIRRIWENLTNCFPSKEGLSKRKAYRGNASKLCRELQTNVVIFIGHVDGITRFRQQLSQAIFIARNMTVKHKEQLNEGTSHVRAWGIPLRKM